MPGGWASPHGSYRARDIPCPLLSVISVGAGALVGVCGWKLCFQWGEPVWPRPNLRAALQLLFGVGGPGWR